MLFRHHILLGFLLTALYGCGSSGRQPGLALQDMGYGRPGLFIYQVKHADASGVVTQIDTLGLFCSDRPVPFMDLQTWMEWQYVHRLPTGEYTVDYNNYVNESTGIWSDDSVLFIHPPRFSYFRILEFCPYPFFNRDSTTWSWDLEIGAIWSIDKLYPIKSTDHFITTYRRLAQRQISTTLGRFDCELITANDSSIYGTSHADYYLNNKNGIVYFAIRPIDNTRFEFSLLGSIHNADSIRRVNKNFKPQNDANFEPLVRPGD